jgi:acid phosphatase
LDSDNFISLPESIFSVADLLDSAGISWGEYQQHLPYVGYEGFEWLNQETQSNDYVRKHNPLILFERITNHPEKLARIKNFTGFYEDLHREALPQWSFITPNMTNDGHDSTIDVAGNWAADFLTPLLNNRYFRERTLVVLTFDESETYTDPNRVLTILLGDIPAHLIGTTDPTYYDHYSLISTVEANWRLPNLGRYDCGANVFQFVAEAVGYRNINVNLDNVYNNESIIGFLTDSNLPIASPDLTCIGAGGKGVLEDIVSVWGNEGHHW